MLIPLIACALAASTPASPKAPKGATFAVMVKSPETALPDLRAFLAEAGARAPALRPTELGRSLGLPLGVDLLDGAALVAAGLDLSAPLAVSSDKGALLVCFTAKDKKAAAGLDAWLAGQGTAVKEVKGGVKISGAVVAKAWRAGYASAGAQLCWASGGDVQGALRDAGEAMSAGGLATLKAFTSLAGGLDGSVIGWVSERDGSVVFALAPSKTALGISGRAQGKFPALQKPEGEDRLGAFKPAAPLVATALFPAKAAADGPGAAAVGFLVSQACPKCDGSVSKGLVDAVKGGATGSVGVVVSRVDATAAVGPLGQYFLFPHAYLLPLKDPKAMGAVLAAAAAKLKAGGATVEERQGAPEGPHWAFGIGARQVFVGVASGVLYVSNEREARDLALAALEAAKPAKPAHGATVVIDGPALASALRRISILDVAKSQEVASLFAFSVEAGALLKALGPVTVTADQDGVAMRFDAKLALQASGAPTAP